MKYSVTAREAFEKLYDESRQLIADMYNRDSDISRIYQKEDIGPSDLEHVICSSIPIDKNSNMLPGKMSSLNKLFQEKFLSRRQIYNVLFKKTEVSRFDLITLDFFIYSQKTEYYETIQQRYTAFLQSINSILEECYLEPIYPANPYESFILMCILSEDPLVTYADALGLSFNQQNPSPNNPTN